MWLATYICTLLCIDINECNEGSKCDQLCTNTNGSYYCSCNKGYRLLNDGKSCKGMYDIVYIHKHMHIFIIQCKKQSFQATYV